jgi:hypothetical protein
VLRHAMRRMVQFLLGSLGADKKLPVVGCMQLAGAAPTGVQQWAGEPLEYIPSNTDWQCQQHTS